MTGKTKVHKQETVPLSLCPPQIPRGLARPNLYILYIQDVQKILGQISGVNPPPPRQHTHIKGEHFLSPNT
jgi:hypothetical protein